LKLFDVVPESFFRLLSRSNKALYAEALLALYEVFQRSHIYIYRSELVAALSSHLSNMIFEMEEEEGEEIGEQFSTRINFIIRQLEDFGWIEKDDNFDLNKYVIPGYALKFIQAMNDLVNFTPQNYNSLVFGTYSEFSRLVFL